MKRLVLAIALACALSGTGFAGDIHTTGAAPAPSPQSSPIVTVILTIISIVAG